MSDIVLITINAKWIHPSFALRLLKANLGAYEKQAEILEFALRQPLAEKTAPILQASPRVLGISVAIWNHTAVIELLDALFQEWEKNGVKRPFIVLGGPEAASLPETAPLFQYADYVARGQGEYVFRELAAFLLDGSGVLSLENLPSAESLSGKFIRAKPVAPQSLDPGYRLYTNEDVSRKLTYVEASRGCPFGCDFCLSALDQRVRFFPLQAFLKNMEDLLKRGARSFKFLDRSFNINADYARSILEFFLFHRDKIKFVHFEMIPSGFSPELREIIARFPPGTLRLEIGIQTFNEKTAMLINRKSDPAEEIETIAFLRRKTSALVHADLIAGLPAEDFASFAQGFDRLWLARPAEIQLGILKVLPSTPLARNAEKLGIVFSPNPPYEVIETSVLSREELDRVKNFARFWELIVNRRNGVLPENEPVFYRFLSIADKLRERFGRNWGIDKKELVEAFNELRGKR
jgi:hypothetical protein